MQYSNKDLSISCVIPMYNEEDNVERIINLAENIFSQIASDWEIIIVESGSTDSTWQKINTVIKDKKRIHAFHQEKKEGFGAAFKLGYSKCNKDLVCHLEADSPFEMAYFKKAIPILIENDCVVGYRVGKKENNFKWSYFNKNKKKSFLRMLFHVSYNLLLRVVFGFIIRDVNFSFKIFRRKHLQDMNFISNGWFIDTEILLELKKKGILPIEMPVEYDDRVIGQSTVKLSAPFEILYEMFAYIWHSHKTKKEIKNA